MGRFNVKSVEWSGMIAKATLKEFLILVSEIFYFFYSDAFIDQDLQHFQ